MNCCLQNILRINLIILYIIQVKASSKIQELQDPTSTSKVIHKTSLNFWINIILLCISFEFQAN